mmetsp:Transcript_34351/g.35019  ORF Transcript_34351/g.35019 Transcript_34351/m.35019 type:complete len:263 (-) Transcript_34351:104-892(-)
MEKITFSIRCLIIVLVIVSRVHPSILTSIKFNDGIIIGSDSLSMKHGSLVSNRFVKNVYTLSKGIAICDVSGGGDFELLLNHLRRVLLNHELNDLQPLAATSISILARALINSNYRSAHILVLGYDGVCIMKDGEYDAYSMHEILPGGSRVCHDLAVVTGTGGPSVQGLLDSLIETLPTATHTINTTKDEVLNTSQINIESFEQSILKRNNEEEEIARDKQRKHGIDITRRVLLSAMKHDSRSGGYANMWILNKNGLTICEG